MPERIQLRRAKGWRKPPGVVVVSRPSKWGNPYTVTGGLTKRQAALGFKAFLRVRGANQGRAITLWYGRQGGKRSLADALQVYPSDSEIREHLAGNDLACWCPLDQPCHADVLLAIANTEESPE